MLRTPFQIARAGIAASEYLCLHAFFHFHPRPEFQNPHANFMLSGALLGKSRKIQEKILFDLFVGRRPTLYARLMAHLEVDVLKTLMLTGVELTEREENHLYHCPECLDLMANAIIHQLQTERVD
jgi:hypothetical protein